MTIKNKECEIIIETDNTFDPYSTDNIYHYDKIHNPLELKTYYLTFSINIKTTDKNISLALIGDRYSFAEKCAVLKDNDLIILLNNFIFKINILTGELVSSNPIETYGCNFEIYQIDNGYIIYGEIEILMLDFNFNVIWRFSGRDIFVTTNDLIPFELCDEIIKLHDFENNYYELTLEGNLIIEKKEE